MSRPTIRLFVPEAPLRVEAYEACAAAVGLGQPPQSAEYRVFIHLAPADAPERGAFVHLSIDEAEFLRAALDTVLDQHRARSRDAN